MIGLETVTTDFADRRNAIMEDEIWERFAEPFLRPVIEEMKEKLQEQMQQQAGQPQQDQGQPQRQGQGRQQSNQSGQGSGQSQGKPSQGQQGQGQGNSEGGESGQPQGQPSQSQQGNQSGGESQGGQDGEGQEASGSQGGTGDSGSKSAGKSSGAEASNAQGNDAQAANQSEGSGTGQPSKSPGKDASANAEPSDSVKGDPMETAGANASQAQNKTDSSAQANADRSTGENAAGKDQDTAIGESKTQVQGVGTMPKVEVPPASPDQARATMKKKDAPGSAKDAKDSKDKDANGIGDDTGDEISAGEKNENAQNSNTKKDAKPDAQIEKDPSAQKDGTQGTEGDSKDTTDGQSASDKENQNVNKARVNELPEAAEPQLGGSGQSIEKLLQELDNAKREKLNVPLNEEGITAAQSQGASSPGRGAGSSATKSLPKIGNWGDYQTSVTLLGAEIRQARNLLVQIQEKQAKTTRNPTRMRSILPDDGDMERFDEVSHEALVTKLLTGQQIAEQDAQRFVIDEEEKTPASIDIVVGIDGSGKQVLGT